MGTKQRWLCGMVATLWLAACTPPTSQEPIPLPMSVCSVNNGGCDKHATCSTDGTTITCTCLAGYEGPGGDGHICKATCNNACDSNATCVAGDMSATCVCNQGYTGTGGQGQCTDIDECAMHLARCDANATCSNTPGSYECQCNTGYKDNAGTAPDPSVQGRSCSDVDECAMGTATCSPNATCTNTVGSYDCTCLPGYEGDGMQCMDVDECQTNNGGCDMHAVCTNTPGSFSCACPPGFTGDGLICNDINECASGMNNCPQVSAHGTCTNTTGSFDCGCTAGFTVQTDMTTGALVCNNVNECAPPAMGQPALNKCDPHATCTDTVGSYTCTCAMGWKGDGFTCTDINECALTPSVCDPNATCTNSPGSYSCACNPHWKKKGTACVPADCQANNGGCDPNAACTTANGLISCSCNPGFNGDGVTCTDINECLVSNGGCDPNAACTNTPGSFSCACNPGFDGNGSTCTLDNACFVNNGGCDANATCTKNPDATYTCACNAGFTGDGLTCADQNDCVVNNITCGPNATCVNVPGPDGCVCNAGWTDPPNTPTAQVGMACVDINECATNNGGCDPNATCTNTPGSFTCTCNSGYTGDGITCTDINECATNNGGCDTNANCINLPGSFFCKCRTGFSGNGQTCQDINECTQGTANCPSTAPCVNTVGSYYCDCSKELYSWNGVACVDGFRSVTAGSTHACGLRANGTIYCWGSNANGQLGDGTTTDHATPIQVGTDTTWTALSAGNGYTCGVKRDGTAWCWGSNTNGQLGDSTTTERHTPTQVQPPSVTTWVVLSAGDAHTCGIRSDQSLWCWGDNKDGEIGDGSTTERHAPVQIGSGIAWAMVSTGGPLPVKSPSVRATWGVSTSFLGYAWGMGAAGQPAVVTPANAHAQALSASDHICAVMQSAPLACFGADDAGQLGDGQTSTTYQSTPADIMGANQWTSISTGPQVSCGAQSDMSIWCWGDNSYGEIGDGTVGNLRLTPVNVSVGQRWESVSVGDHFVCGVRYDGSLWCWGRNDHGQLGDGTTTNHAVGVRSGP